MSSLSEYIYAKTQEYLPLVALRVQCREITYQELNEKALSVASALIGNGAERETIAIVGQRKAASYIGVVGILYAGCSYVPINPKYNKSRVRGILKDANVRFLVGSAEDLKQLNTVISDEELSGIEAVIIPEGKAPQNSNWLDESHFINYSPLVSPVERRGDDLAYLLYTSGSTGTPKGVQVLNSNVLAFLNSMSVNYCLTPGFRASQTFDFSFDPSVSDMFFTWSQGGVLCVLPEEEVMLPHEFIQREKITFWNSVPTIASFMSKMGVLLPGCFPDLQYSMFCGEQFSKHIADAWKKAAPNSTVENLYGPTEATIYISRYVYKNEDNNKPFKNNIIPIGHVFHDHEVALIDENGSKLTTDGVGEILFKGPQITKGYLNDLKKTNSVFSTFEWDHSSSIWYRTGDIGFFNEDGNLECIGRRDSQVKLSGRRIEIGEIEAVLARYPQTSDAVVVPLRDDNEIVVGCLAFTLNEISKDEISFIRSDSEQFLERIFFPKKIIVLDEFPVAPSGKINRRALADMAKQQS